MQHPGFNTLGLLPNSAQAMLREMSRSIAPSFDGMGPQLAAAFRTKAFDGIGMDFSRLMSARVQETFGDRLRSQIGPGFGFAGLALTDQAMAPVRLTVEKMFPGASVFAEPELPIVGADRWVMPTLDDYGYIGDESEEEPGSWRKAGRAVVAATRSLAPKVATAFIVALILRYLGLG